MRTLLQTLLVALLFPAAVFAQKDSAEVARLDRLNVILYQKICRLPDHQPGVYIIQNGIYVRKPD